MSRWDSDLDYYDEPWNRPNADCSDCGEPFTKAPADVGTLCDTCCSLRDAHTSAVEIRMAKAHLKAKAIPVVVDVALVPVSQIRDNRAVVDVALVPQPAATLRRMAAAILSVDLTTIKEVA